RRGCLVEDVVERSLCALDVLPETQLELRVGEPQFPLVDVPEVGSRFQILDGDPELRRQLAERLDRRSPCAGLDPRDVRVRDAWRRQFALRQLPFEPQSAQAPSY